MDASDQAQFDRIERERRRREAELAALLHLLLTGTRRYVASAIRHGLSPADAVTRYVIGSTSLNLPGIARPIAKVMIEAHANAAYRVCHSVGVDMPENQNAERAIARFYQQTANEHASNINKTVSESVRATDAAGASAGKTVNQRVRDLRGAFDAVGMGPEKSHRLDQIATEAVLTADGTGSGAAIRMPEVAAQITALKHLSVIDDGTTPICYARRNICLPPDDPYWHTNYPMLHHGCRSAVVPVMGARIEFKQPPDFLPPPQDGFGLAPWLRGPMAA